MVHPWNGPRHRSWASDTLVSLVLFILLLIATGIADWQNGPEREAPAYLTGLLAASGMALFGAAGSDKSKRDKEVADDAAIAKRRTQTLNEDVIRTEAKTDRLIRRERARDPNDSEVPDPLIDFPPRLQGGDDD